jgi:hypothetical protein
MTKLLTILLFPLIAIAQQPEENIGVESNSPTPSKSPEAKLSDPTQAVKPSDDKYIPPEEMAASMGNSIKLPSDI